MYKQFLYCHACTPDGDGDGDGSGWVGMSRWGSRSLLFYSTELCCVCDWRCTSVFTSFWALTGQPWEMRSFTRGRSPTSHKSCLQEGLLRLLHRIYTQQQSDSFHYLQVEPLTLTPHYSERRDHTPLQHFGCRHPWDTIDAKEEPPWLLLLPWRAQLGRNLQFNWYVVCYLHFKLICLKQRSRSAKLLCKVVPLTHQERACLVSSLSLSFHLYFHEHAVPFLTTNSLHPTMWHSLAQR